jgi:CubicO group peptidase (beta-lactamase class C family)
MITGGMADRQHLTQGQQGTLFRIADLSKPITAVTIFSLIEAGKLNLTDKVFGPTAIFGTKYGKPPYKALGRVIEQVTGESCEAYVHANILARCGITDIQIANNSERHRASNEVVYIGQYSEDPYKININRMDSTDGWIASSTQLVQFLNHVAGGTEYSCPPQARYNSRHPDGSCLAALCNTRTQPHQEMDTALYDMMYDLAQTSLPEAWQRGAYRIFSRLSLTAWLVVRCPYARSRGSNFDSSLSLPACAPGGAALRAV